MIFSPRELRKQALIGVAGAVIATLVFVYAAHAGDARVKPGHDPRPRAWCGWWLRHELGVANRIYNRARAWAHFGSRASGPAAGVIAVWPHHVGVVVSVSGPGAIILKSGNDGHAVRTRERSTRGVIAWRWPDQRTAMVP